MFFLKTLHNRNSLNPLMITTVRVDNPHTGTCINLPYYHTLPTPYASYASYNSSLLEVPSHAVNRILSRLVRE